MFAPMSTLQLMPRYLLIIWLTSCGPSLRTRMPCGVIHVAWCAVVGVAGVCGVQRQAAAVQGWLRAVAAGAAARARATQPAPAGTTRHHKHKQPTRARPPNLDQADGKRAWLDLADELLAD
jgi:hypothetical protein